MSGSRRLSDSLTGLAAHTFPRARRRDATVVRDCAREAIAEQGMRAMAPETVSLAIAGVRTRTRARVTELRGAPWREALSVLPLPLATALLLTWTFGFVPHYDHWPLGVGWAMLLGGSLTAVVGAAISSRWLTALGAFATLVAAAAPHVGLGTENALDNTPSFFQGYQVDIGAASLLPTLLLVVAGLSLPRRQSRPPVRERLWRLAAGLTPALVATVFLIPESHPKPTHAYIVGATATEPKLVTGPPYPMPWISPSRTLVAILGIALALAVVFTWRHARARPAHALASALVLASVAYPLAWVAIRTETLHVPYWVLNGAYPLVVAVLPLLLALILMRRAAHATANR